MQMMHTLAVPQQEIQVEIAKLQGDLELRHDAEIAGLAAVEDLARGVSEASVVEDDAMTKGPSKAQRRRVRVPWADSCAHMCHIVHHVRG